MRDLLLNMPSRRFHFSPTVVIFCLRDGSVASLFRDMRDLLTSGAFGRFAFSQACVTLPPSAGMLASLNPGAASLGSLGTEKRILLHFGS